METTESSEFILTLKHENKTIQGLADLLPGCYDESNGYFSVPCENCINHFGKHTWTRTDSLSTSRFNICFAGDLMLLSYILGLTGPNGKYFCNDCLVTQQDVAKGIPHSPVILPRYQDSDLAQGKTFPVRDLELIAENAQSFKDNGAKTASSYFNCEHVPLVNLKGLVIKHTLVAPLHISLGLGLKNLNVAEEIAVTEDKKKIKELNSLTSDNMTKLLQDRDNCFSELTNLTAEQNELKSCLSAAENSLEVLKSGNIFAFEKDKNKFRDKSKDEVLIRKRANELKKDIERVGKNIKDNEKLEKDKHVTLASILENINKHKGPFKTKFDEVSDSFKSEKTVYHSGALAGNDVNKLTKTENITKLCNIFKPMKIQLSNGTMKVFGSNKLVQLLRTWFIRFRDCYQLYMESRHLCPHEVLKLCIRAYSYGNCLPKNLKEESLSRKFHMLTYEVPRKALMCATVGLEAENCSESIHPFCNKWDTENRTHKWQKL